MPPGGQRTIGRHVVISLCAACTGCIRYQKPRRGAAISLPRRCLHGVHRQGEPYVQKTQNLCLGAACTGCITPQPKATPMPWAFASALPARGASRRQAAQRPAHGLCLGAACTGCISARRPSRCRYSLCLGAACTGCIGGRQASRGRSCSLPRRCLHGVHHSQGNIKPGYIVFASALPARGASAAVQVSVQVESLCLGAACTGCIRNDWRRLHDPEALCLGAACTGCIRCPSTGLTAYPFFASALPARGASAKADKLRHTFL